MDDESGGSGAVIGGGELDCDKDRALIRPLDCIMQGFEEDSVELES